MSRGFDHEKLRVYKTSLEYLAWLESLLERVSGKLAVRTQLDRASTSISLNIAEGNGKFTERDRCRFFDIARGSALECAAGLDVLVAKGVIPQEEIRHGKEVLEGIVAMLVGLIRSNSSDRIHEVEAQYEAVPE